MKIGIFTDIHFQPQGLDRIVKTGNWIVEEFQRQGVQAVVCMGDALVTREMVDVVSQSAALNFFRKLADQWPVFLTLGNHDISYKHSTTVSSLDGLDMHPKIKVFREITVVGDRFLFIPYHEDQSKIVQWVQDYARLNPEKAANITCFGHLGINGAVTNTKYGTTFAGAIGPDIFAPFKATYSGHFHVFQRMDHRVTYVGSPLQFNFGDAGDERGVMILDAVTGEDHFIRNPLCNAFVVVSAKDLQEQPEHAWESLKDCFVTVIYDDIVTEDQHEVIQKQLEAHGVLAVKKESVIEKAIREHTTEMTGVQVNSAVDLVEPFVKSVLTGDSQIDANTAIAFGKAIINEVNTTYQNASSVGEVFEGDITSISMTNFLGVKDTITLDIEKMNSGLWYLEGFNGAGKSTALESIYWAYFGETIRDGMKADDVVHDPDQNGKGKDCEVIVTHANGWSIQRFRKNHKLGGTGVKVYKDGHYREDFEKGDPRATQAKINELLGINAETFIRAYIMGQNVTANFVSGDEKARRAMIEEMLGLERFDAYLEKTRDLKKSIASELEQAAMVQQVRAGEIERSATQVSSIDAQIAQAERQHQANLDRVAQDIADQRVAFKVKTQELDTNILLAEDANKKAFDHWQAAIADHQILGSARANIDATVADLNTRIEVLTNTESRINNDYSLFRQQSAQVDLEVNNTNKSISEAQAKITAISAAVQQEPMVLQKMQEADALRVKASEQDTIAAGAAATQAALAAQSQPIAAKRDRLAKLDSGECPTCTHPIDKAGLGTVVAGLDQELETLRTQWTQANTQAKEAKESAAALRAQADATVKGLPTVAQLDAAKAMVVTLEQTIAGHQTALTKLEAGRSNLPMALIARLKVDAPQQEWATGSDDEIAANRALIAQAIIKLKADIATAQASQDQAAWEKVRKTLDETEKAHIEAERILASLRQEKSVLEAKNTAVIKLRENEQRNLLATDPSQALKTTKDRIIADRTKALAESEEAKSKAFALNQKMAYVVFWDKAFAAKGSMRAFLLEESVKQLNTIIQSYIGQHFGGAMTLTFNADLTFKERYGRRSGGQRKWTDLAVLFSLFELTRQRSRYRATWMALDEVFDALDVQGRRAVQDLLVAMAARVRRIFVITHVDVLGSSRAGTIQATMADGATSLVVRPV